MDGLRRVLPARLWTVTMSFLVLVVLISTFEKKGRLGNKVLNKAIAMGI